MSDPAPPDYAPAKLFSLAGKVAIVTGAASGLGKAIAEGLGAAGAHVVCVDLPDTATAETVGRIGADRASAHHLDVSDVAAVDAMAGAVATAHGRIDVLVNSAGIGGRSPALDYPDDMWERVQAVNLKGTFNVCRAVGRTMVPQGSGSIINIASVGGLAGYGGSVGYQVSKGGVVQLTRTLAAEWAPAGVRVNAIAPTQFDSAIVRAQWEKEPEIADWFRSRVALGRIGQPPEIVGPAIFLASDAASLVTGHILAVDGGFLGTRP